MKIVVLQYGKTRITGELSEEDYDKFYEQTKGQEVIDMKDAVPIINALQKKQVELVKHAVEISWRP